MTNTPTPPAGTSAPATVTPGAPSLPWAPSAVQDAIMALPTDVLQRERQARADAKLDVSAYDAALAAKQTAPINPQIARDHVAAGVAHDPQPSYAVNWGEFGRSSSPEALTAVAQETKAWAAALRMDSTLGSSVIEHLATLAHEFASMSHEQKADWVAQQEALSLRVAGSPEKLEARRAKAMKVIELAAGNDITRGLKTAPTFKSAWLLTALATHADAIALIDKRYPKGK